MESNLRDVQVKSITIGDKEQDKREFIKLVSGDGFEFIIERKYVEVSSTISTLLELNSSVEDSNIISLENVSGQVLEKVCFYFMFKTHYSRMLENVPDFPIEEDLALELLMISNFLDC